MTIRRTTLAAAALLIATALWPSRALAQNDLLAGDADQGAGRFVFGPLNWTPTIVLRDAGLDSNVFDEPENPKEDTVAVVAPSVDASLRTGLFSMTTVGGVEFVYFDRYTNERSINGRLATRIEFPLTRIRPFVGVAYTDAKERTTPEIDLRARYDQLELSGGLGLQLTSRGLLRMYGRTSERSFDDNQTFRSVDLAERLNHRTEGAGLQFRYNITPLTSLLADGLLSRDRFVHVAQHDTDNVRVQGGVEFAPDAIIRGRALVGFHQMQAVGSEAIPYDGVMASVDLTYVLLGRTRFTGRAARDTTYSFEEQPYYLQTSTAFDVLHNLIGPVDIIGRVAREKLDYQGLPARSIAARVDYIDRWGGALSVRISERSSIALNYDWTERRSAKAPEYDYNRRRLFTTVNYGF
jgi:hypothetical protein